MATGVQIKECYGSHWTEHTKRRETTPWEEAARPQEPGRDSDLRTSSRELVSLFSNNSAGLGFLLAGFTCFRITQQFVPRPAFSAPGLITISCRRDCSSPKRSSLGRVVPSSPCQSWDQRPRASSTCACRSAPWRGACWGLTPACGGSSAHILQQTQSLRQGQ